MSTRGIESLPNAESMVDGFVARLGVNAQGPYPNPQISAKNRQYAELMIPAFAEGASSELTGIAQYFQHSLTIQDEVIANAELSISMSEMKHLELLGDMIKSLGATPRYGPW